MLVGLKLGELQSTRKPQEPQEPQVTEPEAFVRAEPSETDVDHADLYVADANDADTSMNSERTWKSFDSWTKYPKSGPSNRWRHEERAQRMENFMKLMQAHHSGFKRLIHRRRLEPHESFDWFGVFSFRCHACNTATGSS
ncbi:unnamed protein product [Durusdinium trenchii]|uniref:Uncharacterized protein n=2 Tax=Durusdinium trenchii TaxID=1381693 RepID=A0ABP0MRA8_9DINO